jgi:hypothetical protein
MRWKEEFLYEVNAVPRSADTQTTYDIYENGKLICRGGNQEQSFWALEDAAQFAVAGSSREVVFLHAGAVEWHGSVILLPGRTRSGKSTLVTHLLQAGAAYLSDEFVVLDHFGRVYPFQCPVHLRADSGIVRLSVPVQKRYPSAEPLQATLILVSKYKRGGQWNPRPLSAGEAMLGLMKNTVVAQTQPQSCMRALAAVVRTSCSFTTVRGEAAEAAVSILELAKRSKNQGHPSLQAPAPVS